MRKQDVSGLFKIFTPLIFPQEDAPPGKITYHGHLRYPLVKATMKRRQRNKIARASRRRNRRNK